MFWKVSGVSWLGWAQGDAESRREEGLPQSAALINLWSGRSFHNASYVYLSPVLPAPRRTGQFSGLSCYSNWNKSCQRAAPIRADLHLLVFGSVLFFIQIQEINSKSAPLPASLSQAKANRPGVWLDYDANERCRFVTGGSCRLSAGNSCGAQRDSDRKLMANGRHLMKWSVKVRLKANQIKKRRSLGC